MSNSISKDLPPTALANDISQGNILGDTNDNNDVPSTTFAKRLVLLDIPSKRRESSVKKEPSKKTGARPRKFRRNWTREEDMALIKIVQAHTFTENVTSHWAHIATKLNNDRTGKQCRDRYQCNLRPDIKKGSWTKEEETLIRQMHKSFGTKWSCMSKLMKHRTDNDIKNKWYSMMRTEKKLAEKAKQKVLPRTSGNVKNQPFNSEEVNQGGKPADVSAPPAPFNFEENSRQGYPASISNYAAMSHPGEFYLLSTRDPSASNWPPSGSSLGAFYNPQQQHSQLVTEFGGSIMLVDSAGKTIGSVAPGAPGFTRYADAADPFVANPNNLRGPSVIPAHIRVQNIRALNAAVMPGEHPEDVSNEAAAKFSSYRYVKENETMDNADVPDIKPMPAYAMNRGRWTEANDTPSNYACASSESNLDVLAEVGLTLGTPFALRRSEKGSPEFKDPVMPMMSTLNLDSGTESGGDAVLPNACVSSPEPSMRTAAIKEEAF